MKIVVLDDYADALRKLVGLDRLAGHDVVIHRDAAKDDDDLVDRLQGAAAVVLIQQRCPLRKEVIERLPELRFISQTGRNLGHLDLDACGRMGIVVSAKGAGSSNSTAELTWGLILAAMRDIPRQARRLKDGAWLDHIGTSLVGKTLGIYAYGNIGSLVAGYGRAFGMRVVCLGREGSTGRAREAGFEVAESRKAFFEAADVVSLHLPMSEETRGIVTPECLSAMKPTALLVNTSRAGIIAPGALHAALTAGRPGFAAVDVYEREPVYGADHPLIALPNALCTPHLGYSTDSSYKPMLSIAVDQLLAYAEGAPINVIVPTVPK